MLLDSKNWSKKIIKIKQQHAYTKSVARLVDSENWSKKQETKQQQHAHTKTVARLVETEKWSKKKNIITKPQSRVHYKCC